MFAGTLVDALLRRLRDSGGVATSRLLAREWLTHAQRFVNAATREVLATYPLTTQVDQCAYTLFGDVTTGVRIEAIRAGNRDVKQIDWRALPQIDLDWFRARGPRHEVFAPFGRDVFFVWPALDETASLDVVVTKLTDTLTVDSVEIEVANDTAPAVLDLAETIACIRLRKFEAGLAALERLRTRFADRLA